MPRHPTKPTEYVCPQCGITFFRKHWRTRPGVTPCCGFSCANKRKPRKHRNVVVRFWEKVVKTEGCWLWTGKSFSSYGYGLLHIRGRGMVRAHRLSWEIHHGLIPDGLWVLHHCDVPRCVRPDHLFLGTHADNMADAHRKGRLVCGQRHSRTLLNPEKVLQIRADIASGMTYTQVANKFGVSRGAIQRVIDRRNWKHV